tara:strand:- start:1169 stop:1687 length:519 start_codon:yes stop_codon:yes gene_type:complete
MFKDIQRGLAKFFSPKMLLVLIISIIAIWGLMSYNGQMKMVRDMMEDGTKEMDAEETTEPTATTGPKPSTGKTEAGYALQPVANPTDLLPTDKNSEWNALNPTNVDDEGVKMPDLLDAGYHIGLDTVGQSMRNANLQLRSDPVIAKSDIGPWNQSTIDGDSTRQPMEIGGRA